MRRFPPTIQQIIQNSGLNLNNISQASGISNPYLAKLIRGKVNRPGKDKLASILLALNYTISEINRVLAAYDYLPLQRADIPDILSNNRARKVVGGNLPQFDHIYFDLLLVVLERIGGTKILVKNRPSGIFMPRRLYLMKEYPFEANDHATRFRYDLTTSLLTERLALFRANCRSGCLHETFICRACLEDYVERNTRCRTNHPAPEKIEHVVNYFANALSFSLKWPSFHKMYVIERCPYFHFQMQDADGDHPKVSYPGRKIHTFDNEFDKRMLEGFTTDLPHIVAYFLQEIEMCRGAVATPWEEHYPESLHDCFSELFERFGLSRSLESALDTLMQNPDSVLY